MCWPAPRLLARAARGIAACAAAPPRSGLSVMRQIQDTLSGRGLVPDRPCRDGRGPSGGMTLARQVRRGPRTALWHRARRSPPIRRAPPPRRTRAPRRAFRNSPIWAVAIKALDHYENLVASGVRQGRRCRRNGHGRGAGPRGCQAPADFRRRLRRHRRGPLQDLSQRAIAGRPLRPPSG